MKQLWFVARGKQKLGPFSAAQLRAQVAAGDIQPQDYLLLEGQTKWRTAASVKGLFPAGASAAVPSVASSPPPIAKPSVPAPKSSSPGSRVLLWSLVGCMPATLVLVCAGLATIWLFNFGTPDTRREPQTSEASSRTGSEDEDLARQRNRDRAVEPKEIRQPDSQPDRANEAGRKSPDVSGEPKEARRPASSAVPPPDTVPTAEHEDAPLLKAGMVFGYTHNQARIAPEFPHQHAQLLGKYLRGSDWRAKFAQIVVGREYVDHLHAKVVARDKKLRGDLPEAVNRSAANAALQIVLGQEPTWDEMLNENNLEGGFVDTIDRMRETKVAINRLELYHLMLAKSAADRIDARYRKGSRPLPESAGLFIWGDMKAKLSYAGDAPLTNVVVVTRVVMKSRSTKTQAAQKGVHAFNELFDPGSERNKMAARYLETSLALQETPQALYFYIPRLERGDVLQVAVLTQGFFTNIQEARVSVYSDAGCVTDKLLVSDGREYAPSLSEAERKARQGTKDFEPVARKTQVTLQPGAAGSFERCIPVGDQTYLPLGSRDEVASDKPLDVIAKNGDAFVAVGPQKGTGNGLILVPAGVVARVDEEAAPKPPERGTVQFLKPTIWILLKPAPDGAESYTFQTCSSLLSGICTKTGRTAQVMVRSDEALRAVATWNEDYVVFLDKKASDGSKVALIPKNMVRETKNKK